MKDKEEEEDEKPPLARWAGIVQSASLSTKSGGQRFVVTIKLPERSLKSASSFVKEMNDALRLKGDTELTVQFVLVDSERTRLQRATASFFTFKEAQTCLTLLKELGLPTNDISAELEDFGKKKYDRWYKSISQSWWPWLAAWRNPPPEMPMTKAKNRLDVAEGGKYKVGAGGKLEKSDDADRGDAQGDENEKLETGREADQGDAGGDENESGGKKRKKKKPRKEEGQDEGNALREKA